MKHFLLILTTFMCTGLSAQTLVINELMQSNVETIMDDIKEFPDSWVELYNPTDAAINLNDYKIGTKNKASKAWQLPDQEVPAGGHVIIYCDKEGKEDNRLHTDFRLESGKDGNLYLFKDGEIVDKLEKMAKMPSPDVAYGRETDGSETWGYELQVTPGAANEGGVVNADHLLGAPVFSHQGRLLESGKRIRLVIKVPNGSPEGTVIRYTTDGSEPTDTSAIYKTTFIENTTVIRAKLFCEGWLSPVSTAQSYIFHPRAMTVPIFSVMTNDKYLNDKEIGLFANNKSKEDKKLHDWRRPVNIEFFPTESGSAFNQLSETRIQGGQSRANALKSMVFYANKRFDPDHKRFSYEFFPDQKPGVTEFKSFSLRDGGNDFDDLFFRDLIIQRTMGSHTDLDWQAGHTAVLYINGEYMGMLNIRERSNEDNIYSNYNGLEDLDMIEISHEKVNEVDQFIEEQKEGTGDFYEAFKNFYSEKGHTLEEYNQWMDVSEYLNVMITNLFYGNIDFPGNNIVFWRPNDDDTESGLPKTWRFIMKDTDFGLGLYGRKNDYNTIDLLYNPSAHPDDNWAFTEPATRLIKNMLEDPDILNMFIDKCCVFMGDFMNAEGTSKTIDAIMDEALDEFVAHRAKYQTWGGNSREEITNKFNDAKKWLAGYTEQGWWGNPDITYSPRTDNFYNFIGQQWNLGEPVTLTINQSKQDVAITINGIELSENTFNGKFFADRQLTITGTAPEGQVVTGWRLSGARNEEVDGSELTINMTSSELNIEPIFGETAGSIKTLVINELMQSNIDCYMDDLVDFPDSWVELYNPTNASINLKDYKIGIKDEVSKAWQLPDQMVSAHQYVLIFCDKAGEDAGVSALHTNFRLESGKDGNIYLFNGDEVVDKLEKMAKQPAPNIAYGRKTDGGDEWGYELEPTPGTANQGGVVTAKKLLGIPVFSEQGRVVVGSQNFMLTLSVPEGSPEGTIIRYTTDGSEPIGNSQEYTSAIPVTSSMVIRAKLFCEGYLSPYSTVQSYIVHDQDMTMPIISIVIDDRYLNDAKIGIFANNNSHEKSEQHDWRRPMNIELFDTQGAAAKLNQLGETRITGAWSREAEKKSMAIYAHKRFGEKRLAYEFFPDQCPGLKEYKSVVLRNAGNDRDGLYMRDAIAQLVMGEHTDLDYQAYRPAVVYINGKYHCILNIRERSNEDYVYTHYDKLEDIDLLENGELKEGTRDNYDAFTAFYNEHGHTLAEYAELMDWKEFINITLMNIYFNNLDYPANNNIIWRPIAEGGKWRWIGKDVDYSMGLYGSNAGTSGSYDYRLLAKWLNPDDQSIPEAISITWESTRLFRRLLEDDDFKREFIDRTCIYMGDFLNEQGIRAIWDPMYENLMVEWPKHRESISYYNQWWPIYNDELNNVRNWISKRTNEMYKQLGDVFNLGTPVVLAINKSTSNALAELTFNGVKVTKKVFDGQFFANRTITLSASAAEEGKTVTGWRLSGARNEEVEGSELTINMTEEALNIEPILGEATGIKTVDHSTLTTQPSPIYDLKGNRVTTPKAGNIYIQNGKKISWR